MPRKTKAQLAEEERAALQSEDTSLPQEESGQPQEQPEPAEELADSGGSASESTEITDAPDTIPPEADEAEDPPTPATPDLSPEPAEEQAAESVPAFPEEQAAESVPEFSNEAAGEAAPDSPDAAPEDKATALPATNAVEEAVEPEPPKPAKPLSARQVFYQTDFKGLDRDLSPEQKQEWDAIYASFRAASILTGTVVGVDNNTFDMTDPDTGETVRRTVQSLVVIDYRIKVLIPESEIWAAGEERPGHVVRGMVGARIDYVIMNVDREGECAIASRKMALAKRRRHLAATHSRQLGELVECGVLLVGAKRLLVSYGGFDLSMSQRELSYTAIPDLRREYRPGQELTARFTDWRDGKPMLSVKEVNPNPFDGAEQRHPVGCRRRAVISGKYAGGIFCTLDDGVTCMCLYSNNHFDNEFYTDDTVLVYITRYDYNRKQIYGRIVSKW